MAYLRWRHLDRVAYLGAAGQPAGLHKIPRTIFARVLDSQAALLYSVHVDSKHPTREAAYNERSGERVSHRWPQRTRA